MLGQAWSERGRARAPPTHPLLHPPHPTPPHPIHPPHPNPTRHYPRAADRQGAAVARGHHEVERIARSFWADRPDAYIGVHCAYGAPPVRAQRGSTRGAACTWRRAGGRASRRHAHPPVPCRLQPHRVCGLLLPLPGLRPHRGPGAGELCGGAPAGGQARAVCAGAVRQARGRLARRLLVSRSQDAVHRGHVLLPIAQLQTLPARPARPQVWQCQPAAHA